MGIAWDGKIHDNGRVFTPEQWVAFQLQRIDRLTIRALSYLGEQCVIKARHRPQSASWVDHTGNLRSSIGYVIVRDREIVKLSDFAPTMATGLDGSAQGKEYAMKLASQMAGGYTLIVVAGMNYASFVESIASKDVLASAELYAEQRLPGMMEQLKRQIEQNRQI